MRQLGSGISVVVRKLDVEEDGAVVPMDFLGVAVFGPIRNEPSSLWAASVLSKNNSLIHVSAIAFPFVSSPILRIVNGLIQTALPQNALRWDSIDDWSKKTKISHRPVPSIELPF